MLLKFSINAIFTANLIWFATFVNFERNLKDL